MAKHYVKVTFSDSENDTASVNLVMDDEMWEFWLNLESATLAGLGVESLAYNTGPGEKPYVFRKIS